jgi:glutamyl-tRNA synthetase
MLCSAIDDFDYGITHIFRGEDHINNTAIQLQMLEALGAPIPTFGHLSFLKAKDDKISKRVGGFEVSSLAKEGIEPMAVNSFFTYIGTSKPVMPKKSLQNLVDDFQIDAFSSSPTIYDAQELWLLNHKLLINLDYSDIADELKKIGADKVDAQFWLAVRGNLNNLKEVKLWWDVCKTHPKLDAELDQDFLSAAAKLLPQGNLDEATWGAWTGSISQETGKKGRELFMPLRLALTGMDHGPEMKMLLPLIDRDEVLKRLNK